MNVIDMPATTLPRALAEMTAACADLRRALRWMTAIACVCAVAGVVTTMAALGLFVLWIGTFS